MEDKTVITPIVIMSFKVKQMSNTPQIIAPEQYS